MTIATGCTDPAGAAAGPSDACRMLSVACRHWADRFRPPHAIEIPARVRKWPYGPLGPYNGFTGEERIGGWQVMKYLQQRNLLPRPSECELCGHNGRVGFHGEDYFDPWSVVALCVGCHGILHRRFKHPHTWLDRLNGNAGRPAVSLLRSIPMQEVDFASWLRKNSCNPLQPAASPQSTPAP